MCVSIPSGVVTVVPDSHVSALGSVSEQGSESLFAARSLSSSQGDRAAALGSSSVGFHVSIFVGKCVLESVQV